MTLAATGATWGIPGPTFLLYYIAALVVITVGAIVHRRRLFAGPRDAQLDQLGPPQVAYLAGGPRLAVYSALGGLRATGAVGAGPDRTLVQAGPLASGATPLETAIYNAAGKRVRARYVHADQWVRTALTQLGDGLEAAGLATSAARRRTARLWALAALALLVLGIARVASGIANDKPVGFLLPLLFVAGVVALLLARVPRQTRAVAGGLAALRAKNHYLSPRQSPSYSTYGAGSVALGVALFGTASLYSLDPQFAAEAEIQRMAAYSGWSASGGSSSSWSSGSSCGSASSCSSGSSSGSSCGGGGGGCGG
ncbi:uncharacterized protein (TIGR04222 family) [Krasilnikovia cinnamomea]|uniref:Uncharacterized protein (TIGR04222 family) n=1 Tax=Krasilnikovia cinnamomea TaxID=349313 RepID=A0A4Q7ZQN6_9ACTN|nr:TIGR04222 domain-containing membrane protein [Krasilnikovia cinnamomea]RZU53094.1 uncharacterized protein (TIGR04222 family) [Krasilnikovia cinnamomea]